MMREKQTKESLIVELAKIRQSHEEWVTGDERRRKEFAKAFTWGKRQEMYSPMSWEPRLPTWEEILVEIGKLLSARNFYDFEETVSELECKLEDLTNKIKKEIQPN